MLNVLSFTVSYLLHAFSRNSFRFSSAKCHVCVVDERENFPVKFDGKKKKMCCRANVTKALFFQWNCSKNQIDLVIDHDTKIIMHHTHTHLFILYQFWNINFRMECHRFIFMRLIFQRWALSSIIFWHNSVKI